MTTELQILAWAAVFGLAQAVATGQFTTAQHGVAYAVGPRDTREPNTGIGARMDRAFTNYLQTFVFFAVAVLIARAAGISTGLTVAGAWLYLIARLVYLPLYLAGVPVVRTLAFLGGLVGIILILVALT